MRVSRMSMYMYICIYPCVIHVYIYRYMNKELSFTMNSSSNYICKLYIFLGEETCVEVQGMKRRQPFEDRRAVWRRTQTVHVLYGVAGRGWLWVPGQGTEMPRNRKRSIRRSKDLIIEDPRAVIWSSVFARELQRHKKPLPDSLQRGSIHRMHIFATSFASERQYVNFLAQTQLLSYHFHLHMNFSR